MTSSKVCSIVLLACILTTTTRTMATEPRPVTAVFLIENRGSPLGKEDLVSLTDYLGTRLGEGGLFQIIPRAEIKTRLSEQKSESFKACYDQGCQIEIGRELAARYTVSASVARIGSQCVITANMYDLEKAATFRTATARDKCTADKLVVALERISSTLRDEKRTAAAKPVPTVPIADASTPAPRTPPRPRLPPSSTHVRFDTLDEEREFSVVLIAADGISHQCPEVRLGKRCDLGQLVQGPARLVARAPELGTYTDTVDIGDDAELWVYNLEKRSNHGSVISWSFGGLAMATGAALIPTGAGIDSDGMIWGGIASAAGGIGLLVLGFFFEGAVDVDEDEFDLPKGVSFVPAPGGLAVAGSF